MFFKYTYENDTSGNCDVCTKQYTLGNKYVMKKIYSCPIISIFDVYDSVRDLMNVIQCNLKLIVPRRFLKQYFFVFKIEGKKN